MEPFLHSLGYRDAALTFIPVSGFKGLHVAQRHILSSDYPADLPCLLEALDSAVLEPGDSATSETLSMVAAPFRAIIYQLLKTSGSGSVFVEVKIESGMVSAGETALVLPLGQKCTVKSIEVKEMAESGFISVHEKNCFVNDYVILALAGIEPTFLKFVTSCHVTQNPFSKPYFLRYSFIHSFIHSLSIVTLVGLGSCFVSPPFLCP